MGFLDRLFNRDPTNLRTVSGYEMVLDAGDGFFAYSGKLYESDIVRSCIRPKAQAVGKTTGMHLREGTNGTSINPDVYLKFLLEEPNDLMTGQMLLEKLTVQLMLNNNAFALIQRDENGLANGIFPIDSTFVEALQDSQGRVYLKFTLRDGKTYTFNYSDIIHLRRDFNQHKVFGDSPAKALTGLMDVINTTDQGVVKAIKNSNIIRWLLKFNQTLRPEDIEENTKKFVKSFLNVDSEMSGAAAIDSKVDAQQVEPKSFVPDSKQTEGTLNRVYGFFNTNPKIVNSSYSEDEWISYYEAEIEPVLIQLSGEFTRKIFSRRERGYGNKIIFESSNLSFASMKTKLGLVQFVDRGILNPNEIRKILNLAPIEGGDVYIRRLDTAEIENGGDKQHDNQN